MPSDLEILLAACYRDPTDRTQWLVLADALQEAGRDDEAALIRASAPVRVIGGRVWPDRVPDWWLVYDPDADGAPGLAHVYYGDERDGTYFPTECGLVVRGEGRAHELVAARTAALAAVGIDDPDFQVEPFDFNNLATDTAAEETLAEDIADRLRP